MKNAVDLRRCLSDQGRVTDVPGGYLETIHTGPLNRLDIAPPSIGEVIQNPDPVAIGKKTLNKMRANKATTAGDQIVRHDLEPFQFWGSLALERISCVDNSQ